MIDAAQPGTVIKAYLSALYDTGRFLGGVEKTTPLGSIVIDRQTMSFSFPAVRPSYDRASSSIRFPTMVKWPNHEPASLASHANVGDGCGRTPIMIELAWSTDRGF